MKMNDERLLDVLLVDAAASVLADRDAEIARLQTRVMILTGALIELSDVAETWPDDTDVLERARLALDWTQEGEG